MRLAGKVALIAGAATGVEGQLMGFGGASSWLFCREGAKVVLADINEELGEVTASQLRDSGYEAIFIGLDVTSEQGWIDTIQTTVSRFGRLDILVNSAGTALRSTVEETTQEIWDDQLDVHARGTYLGAKHAIPEMRKAGGGSIVNVSSIMGLVGSANSTAYHTAKGAVRLFTKTAAVQYAKEGIRVNAVLPGFAMTPLTQEFFQSEVLESRVALVPMGRLANAEEVAHAILYLASDESSFMTGADLVIDGGMTAL